MHRRFWQQLHRPGAGYCPEEQRLDQLGPSGQTSLSKLGRLQRHPSRRARKWHGDLVSSKGSSAESRAFGSLSCFKHATEMRSPSALSYFFGGRGRVSAELCEDWYTPGRKL